MAKFLKSNYLLLGILLLAVLFRFWQIAHLPGGLFPDEAANGLDINSMIRGHLQPFYERGNGREALFFYLEAAAVLLFGIGQWQLHIVTALVGVLEILATYFLTKRLFGKNIALLAAFFMTVSSYAVSLNHNSFRANLLPLFVTLTLLFLVKFFQVSDPPQKRWAAIFAGLCFGLGFYTYIAYRMMVPLLALWLMLLLWARRGQLKAVVAADYKYALWFTGVFVVAVAWIAEYFIAHPGSFFGRAGEVSIFSKDLNHGNVLLTFLQVLQTTLLGFFTRGDLNWRHNVSGFPFLSPFISGFFAIALIAFSIQALLLLKNSWQKKIAEQNVYQALTALWFWMFLAPEVTTAEGIPHGLRLVGVIPPIFILSAWGLAKIWTWLKKFLRNVDLRLALVGTFLLLVFLYNFLLFFGVSAATPDYYYAFRADLTTVSAYLNARNQKDHTYLSLDDYSVQTVQFLTTPMNQPYRLLDPARTYQIALVPGDQVIFTQSTFYDRLKFRQTHPRAKLVALARDQFGGFTMLIYQEQ